MLTARAPAKVNLNLYISGKREDGYHEIHTLVAFPDIADELRFEASDLLTLQVDGEFAPQAGSGANNLVLRAARALNSAAGTRHGARITLTKHLPVGAGLGGGSSDAAATLKALNEFWGLGLSFEELLDIAETLGADVPMCLYAQPLYAGGVGEIIHPAETIYPGYWMVLVYPHWLIATKDVFAAIDADMYSQFLFDMNSALQVENVFDDRNHLVEPALLIEPRLRALFDIVAEAAAPGEEPAEHVLAMRMTGSGSATFVLLDDEDAAKACAARVQHAQPGWWVKTAKVTIGN